MNTSKYDQSTRYKIKRDLRSPEVTRILAEGREQRAELEATLRERKVRIRDLEAALQSQIDAGAWNEKWAALGFKKKPEPETEAA